MEDAFDVLGVEPRFAVDEADLHRRFIALSAEAHPDRHTDPMAQAEASERAAQINHAYRTLTDPQSRAEALLKRLGGAEAGDHKALPPDLLMEVMSVREEMEEAVASDDRATLDRLRGWAQQNKADQLRKIAAAFESGGEPAKVAKAVQLELNALRYMQRMLDQMPD